MHFKKIALGLLLPLVFAGGLAAGCALSDYVALTGFPHKKFQVELRLAGTARSAYDCQRLSNAFGPELSFFNETKGQQDRCILEVTGELNADGSMRWYPGNLTWYGRVVQGHPPVVVPSSRILAAREVRR